MTRTCPQCERPFEAKRPHQIYDSEECSYQGWIQKQVEAAEATDQRVEEHPLADARAAQEATDLKSKLSGLIYQAIIFKLEKGPVHADDLEDLFPEEHRGLCRRLTGAQFGSLASRHYIFEKERRKSSVPTRKGAKSGVFEFTRLGREKLAGVTTGVSAPQGPGGAVDGVPTGASSDPGGGSPVASRQQTHGAGEPRPIPLPGFEEEQRALNPLADAEAA